MFANPKGNESKSAFTKPVKCMFPAANPLMVPFVLAKCSPFATDLLLSQKVGAWYSSGSPKGQPCFSWLRLSLRRPTRPIWGFGACLVWCVEYTRCDFWEHRAPLHGSVLLGLRASAVFAFLLTPTGFIPPLADSAVLFACMYHG